MAVLLGLSVVLPLLAPGFVLRYDMVFVPSPPFSADMLGLGRQLPRSVPSALLVAILSRAATGQVVQKLALFGIFAGGAFGAARLIPSSRPAGRIAGGILYAWNPMTYERLLLGQWAFLLGYAVLPWVAAAALSFRRGKEGSTWRLILALAAAVAPSPYTGILGALIAWAIALTPSRDTGHEAAGHRVTGPRAAAAVGAGIVVNLPWLVPGLLFAGGQDRPTLAVSLFRARSDSPLGTVGSLLSLGGLWRTDLAPPGRDTGAWIPAFLLVAALALMGWRALRQRWPSGAPSGLVGLSLVGLLLAAAPSVSALRPAIGRLEGLVPGGGFLRDSQKFVVPFALVLAVGFGVGVERALGRFPDRRQRFVGALALCALPLSLAPILAWGATGRLSTANYPASWARVERLSAHDPSPGAMLVLPWHAYQSFRWNQAPTVRQPAVTFFSREVVASTALEVGRSRLPEEDEWSALAAGPATDAAPLAPRLPSLGVRYVLLFKEAEWRSLMPKLAGLQKAVDAPDLALFVHRRSPGQVPVHRTPVLPVVAGDCLALVLFLAAVAALARPRSSSVARARMGMLGWARNDRGQKGC